ncbi:MAG: nucleotide sugar dehydrogenase [Terriglobia bacterium]
MNTLIASGLPESHAETQNSLRLLLRKIRRRQARVGIIGLGYVGLPLAVEFAGAGFSVTGFDIDCRRTEQANNGSSYIRDVNDQMLWRQVESGRFRATNDFAELSEMDTISICVPTPLRKTKDPDLSYVIQAVEAVAEHLHRGQLIILESTTYPGTTEEIVLPVLERNFLKVGEDFFLAFSPERVDPGNARFQTRNVPKVVGGITRRCTLAAQALYATCVDRVVKVSSVRTAEMVKLLENTYRNVNIGLANEMALLCHKFDVDVWEVIEAASSKPFGFTPFYPGPGLGGHCIPIDPVYLTWKARANGFEPRLIELAQQINSSMPSHVVDCVTRALNERAKPLRDSQVHILGVAYKRDVADVRESPALDIMHLLAERKARLSYSDPYVPRLSEPGIDLDSEPVSALSQKDCAVIVTDHSCVDYKEILRVAPLIVDTRNALRGIKDEKIFRL